MKQRFETLTAEWKAAALLAKQPIREFFLSHACGMLAGILKMPGLEDARPSFLVKEYAGQERDVVSGFYCNTDVEYDVDAGILHLLVCDYCTDDELRKITKTDFTNYFKRLRRFYLDAVDGRYDNMPAGAPVSPLLDLIKSQEFRQNVSALNLHLITNQVCDHALPEEEVMPNGMRVRYQVSDFGTISTAKLEPVVLDFTRRPDRLYGQGLPYLPAAMGGGADFFQSYLLVMPAEALVECYEHFRGRILENNVRVYLQRRGKVNKGIHATIDSDPLVFFVYNNGLALTADSVDFSDDGSRIEKIRGLQVVNGGQTMACLHDASRKGKDISCISVQAKLTVIPTLITPAIVPYISRYSNSQNSVKDSDQHSNDIVQRFLEQKSRTIIAPGRVRTQWYYERMRGQYDNELLHKAAKEQNYFKHCYPKSQVVRPEGLAKAVMACEMMPYLVARGGQKTYNGVGSIRGFSDYTDAVFRQMPGYILREDWYRECMGKYILMVRAETVVKHMLAEEFRQFQSYAAGLLAYSLASLVYLLSKLNQSVNWQRVWVEQGMDASMENDIKNIARCLMAHISKRGDHSEWLKKEEAWIFLRENLEEGGCILESGNRFYTQEPPVLLSGISKKRVKASYTKEQARVLCKIPDCYWQSLATWLGDFPQYLEKRLAHAELSQSSCVKLEALATRSMERGWVPPVDIDSSPEMEGCRLSCEEGNPLASFFDESRAEILVLERTVDMQGGSVLLPMLFERLPWLQKAEQERYGEREPLLGSFAAYDLDDGKKVVFAYARNTAHSATYLPIVEMCLQKIADTYPKSEILTVYFNSEDSSPESRLRHSKIKEVVARVMYTHPVIMMALPREG